MENKTSNILSIYARYEMSFSCVYERCNISRFIHAMCHQCCASVWNENLFIQNYLRMPFWKVPSLIPEPFFQGLLQFQARDTLSSRDMMDIFEEKFIEKTAHTLFGQLMIIQPSQRWHFTWCVTPNKQFCNTWNMSMNEINV